MVVIPDDNVFRLEHHPRISATTVDPTGMLSLDQVQALPENVWQQASLDALRFGFTSDV